MSETCGFCKGAVFFDNEGEVQDAPHGGPHDCAEVLLAERDALKLQNRALKEQLFQFNIEHDNWYCRVCKLGQGSRDFDSIKNLHGQDCPIGRITEKRGMK